MKKLLILGAGKDEVEIVKHAREKGIYTIVTDYYENWNVCPAKSIADEAWNISWSDINCLEKKCLKHNVDGIISGFSEIKVDCNIKLCSRLKKPCYANEEQLEITRDKELFKKYCKFNGIKVVNQYSNMAECTRKNCYPVIIKPTDRGGSIGIKVAYGKEELQKCYDYAMEKSISKNVIIEDFMENCCKIDGMYIIHNGIPKLLGTCDTLDSELYYGKKLAPLGWKYPSDYHYEYVEAVDELVKKMLESLNINFGYFAISFFMDNNGEFYAFEAAYRLTGGHSYTCYKKWYGYDYLDMLIEYALNGDVVDQDINKVIEKPDNTIFEYMLHLNNGQINDIEGKYSIKQIPNVMQYIQYVEELDLIENNGATLSTAFKCTFFGENDNVLFRIIDEINRVFYVNDKIGQNMVSEYLNPNRVLGDKWNG